MSLCQVLAPLRTRLYNIARASVGSEGRPNLTNRQCYCIALERVQDLCPDEWKEQAEKLKHVNRPISLQRARISRKWILFA